MVSDKSGNMVEFEPTLLRWSLVAENTARFLLPVLIAVFAGGLLLLLIGENPLEIYQLMLSEGERLGLKASH